ncbi:hypothetical protein A3K73_03330 [Candidatus Pacearchaeota archaeon RBG_13_36_9]|nr:MAG: hypothetical protein A3K73_03330 [Candidatus Pacearchaeota archaeon RBG_13_36_9]
MDYESIRNFVTSAPVIGAAIIAGSSALSISIYEHYFSETRLERAKLRKEVRLAKETTLQLEATARQQEIALEKERLTTETSLKRMEHEEDEKKHARKKELMELEGANKQRLLETKLEYQERIAAKIVEMKDVFSRYAHTYAIAAATVDQIKITERMKLRTELYQRVDEEMEERERGFNPAEKIVDGETVYPPDVVTQVESIIRARVPIVEGEFPLVLEALINMMTPSKLVRDIQEETESVTVS